ncbi:hypothetical protein [Ornithinibacillus sp. 179-J 7C1 HS]|uniref:hypothetical protein n=1 Tax=Ornithinibacillus sp. 179-J 7C1 HS TaxID=3142384 RepID=UPI00399FB64F
MKKLILYIFIILLLISIYKDLNVGTNTYTSNNTGENESNSMSTNSRFDVIKVKIESGDTVLTVIEQLNPNMENYNTGDILADFYSLNPNVDPNKLKQNHFYFFPKYEEIKKKKARN